MKTLFTEEICTQEIHYGTNQNCRSWLKYPNELLKAKEKADESERLKEFFLHSISHEIRTPMNIILGFLELIMGPDITVAKKQEYYNFIQSSASHLINLIDDLILASQIKAGGINTIREKIEVNVLLEEIYQTYYSLAKSKGLLLTMRTMPSPNFILTDKQKLKQILGHLLDNAIKFTSKGSVSFGYRMKSNGSADISFYVKDTGIGIKEKDKENIFGFFNQIETEEFNKPDGTGLGLYIAKSYSKALGGNIVVESTEGQGSEFIVTF